MTLQPSWGTFGNTHYGLGDSYDDLIIFVGRIRVGHAHARGARHRGQRRPGSRDQQKLPVVRAAGGELRLVHEGDGAHSAHLERTHLGREVLEARDDQHGAHLVRAKVRG